MASLSAAQIKRSMRRYRRQPPQRSWARRNAMGLLTIISGVVIGLWIPTQISINESAEADAQRCLEQVLALRESASSLQRGYSVDRADKPNRLADWDDTLSRLELTKASCETDSIDDRQFLMRVDDDGASFLSVESAFRESMEDSASGRWTEGTQNRVLGIELWTSWAVGALPR